MREEVKEQVQYIAAEKTKQRQKQTPANQVEADQIQNEKDHAHPKEKFEFQT